MTVLLTEYLNTSTSNSGIVVEEPAHYVRIDSLNGNTNGIQLFYGHEFTPNQTIERPGSFWVGLSRNSSATSCTFTKTITLPYTGIYLIELMIWKRPQTTQNFTVTFDGNTILTESAHNDWEDYGTVVRCPILERVSSGSHTLTVTLPKHAFIAWAKISHINRYTSGETIDKSNNQRLDINELEFTQNGVTELNTATIDMLLDDKYFVDYENHQPLVFDLGDHVTIACGSDKKTLVPLFGGYVSGWELDDETLKVVCVDRLWDLQRVPIYKNFSIGYLPQNDTGRMPFTQFPTVYEIARYLCTSLYQLKFNAKTSDAIFYNNFNTATDVNNLTVSGDNLETSWETVFGNPAPCMRVRASGYGKGSILLYQSPFGEWDAKEYNYFNFDYYSSGGSNRQPLRFNVEFDVDVSGNGVATYTVMFNGTYVSTRNIGSVTPLFNGSWNHFTVDLKSLLDKKNPGSSYIVRAVRLKFENTYEQTYNPRCSSIYIDQVMAYKEISATPRYESADTKTAYEELEDLCKKTGFMAYIQPGMERRDDILVMKPERFYTVATEFIEGYNIRSISNCEYNPVEWGLYNHAHRTFNYNENTSGTVEYTVPESAKRYGVISDHEFLSDVTTYEDANAEVNRFLEQNSWKYPAFTVSIQGTPFIEPGQYARVVAPSKRLDSHYIIQSIVHKMNIRDSEYETDVSFNRPGLRFINILRDIKKNIRRNGVIDARINYGRFGLTALGGETSTGAFGR